MVKDPWWLYAYWEIQPVTERAARSQLLPQEVAGLQSILRVYDVTDRNFPEQPAHRWFDISLSSLATNWYLHTDAPGRSFIVEIGLLTHEGRFLLLARSNRVTAPRFGPSDVIDEAWASAEDLYWKLSGLAHGLGPGASEQWLARRPFSPGMFSAGLFSPIRAPRPKRFWLWVDTEVVVYGATDPKASLTVQGQSVKLRPDGTFSVRMAFPDGHQVVPVEAVSADGQANCTVTSTLTRQTHGQSSADHPQASPRQAAES